MPTESPVRRWQSLSVRLVLAFMLLAGLALGLALVATTIAVEDAAEEKIQSDLTRTLEAFQKIARSSQARIRDVAEVRARDRTFKDMALSVNSQDDAAGLEEGDVESEGIEEARAIISSADTDVFGYGEREHIWAFFNVRQRLIFTHGDDEQWGAVVELPLLERALKEGALSTLWSPAQLRALPFTFVPEERIRQMDLLLVHAHPIFDREGRAQSRARPLGVVLSGRWVSELLLEDPVEQGPSGPVMRDARARFALRSEDGALATTLPPGTVLEDPGFSARDTRLLRIEKDRYLAREEVFQGVDGQPIGQVFVVRNLDAEIAPILSGFGARLVPTAVGVGLLALALAVFVARRLSAPLVQLEAAARRVRLGELDVEVPVRSTDEVGRLTDSFNEMVAGLRQRDQIKGLFKRYLDPQVVDELIRNPEKAAPGGERRELTILFSDLVGFTSMSEELSPEALVELLNGYFEQATDTLGRHGATLDKFIGDAIMCFWNAPLPQEDHAARACLSALGLMKVVDTLAPKLEAMGLPRWDCRIGINTGPGVVGNIGSRAAQDYTVIGDTVNLASRLEGAAGVYGTRTLVSEETVLAARGAVLTRELDWLRVKGRQLPVRVYELVALGGTPPPPHLARFAEGLALYRARRFAEAQAAFLASPEDASSRVFASRCAALLMQPPPEGWDGVFSLASK